MHREAAGKQEHAVLRPFSNIGRVSTAEQAPTWLDQRATETQEMLSHSLAAGSVGAR